MIGNHDTSRNRAARLPPSAPVTALLNTASAMSTMRKFPSVGMMRVGDSTTTAASAAASQVRTPRILS